MIHNLLLFLTSVGTGAAAGGLALLYPRALDLVRQCKEKS